MKDINWLVNRLKSMNVLEMIWRVQQKLIQRKEYKEYYALHVPVTEISLTNDLEGLKFDVHKLPLNLDNHNTSVFEVLDIFGQFDYKEFKNRWNAGFQTDKNWPEGDFSYNIPIGQREDIGDIRTNWELNRHYQFACLAKNYYMSGNLVYLEELTELFDDWNRHNLFLHGAEWTSAMEVGIRSLSWIYTYAFLYHAFEKYGEKENGLLKKLSHGLLVMADYIVKHRARYSSANNHLVVEMFAVGMVGVIFDKKEWVNMTVKILTDELPKQNHKDGVNKEMSLHYQSFLMEAYGILWLTLQKNDVAVPAVWKKYLTSMSEYLADCCGVYGEVVVFGDNDEGKLLDLQGKIEDHYRYVLQLMGVLLEQRYTELPLIENICWLINEQQKEEYDSKKKYKSGIVSSYQKGGYTILRSKDRKVLIGMDHAELGFGSIAAHGHADALSIQLYYCGEPVLVDSGTYNYHVPKKARDEFRSTKAHNTIYIDGAEQAKMLGPFLWGKKYKVEKVTVVKKNNCVVIDAKISYFGISHTRKLLFDYDRKMVIDDTVTGTDTACQMWHLPASQNVQLLDRVMKSKNMIAQIENTFQLDKVEYSDKYGRRDVSDCICLNVSEGRISTKFIVK